MREARVRAALAAVLTACVLAVSGAGTPAAASWPDREIVTARFTAKTIPPVTVPGAAPYCSWTGPVLSPNLVLQWALPSGYSLSAVTFTAYKGVANSAVTGQSSSLVAGVYTTTIPISLLDDLGGTLLGGTIAIHVIVRDPATGWLSVPVIYSYTLNPVGIVIRCTTGAA